MEYLFSLLLLVVAYPGIHQLEWEAHRNVPPAVKGDGTKPAWGPLVKNPAQALTRTVYGYSPYWTNVSYLHFNLMPPLACFIDTLARHRRGRNHGRRSLHAADRRMPGILRHGTGNAGEPHVPRAARRGEARPDPGIAAMSGPVFMNFTVTATSHSLADYRARAAGTRRSRRH